MTGVPDNKLHGMHRYLIHSIAYFIFYSAYISAASQLTGFADPVTHIIHCELSDCNFSSAIELAETKIDFMNCQLMLRIATAEKKPPILGVKFKGSTLSWDAIRHIGMFYIECYRFSVTAPTERWTGFIRVSSHNDDNSFLEPKAAYTNKHGHPCYRDICLEGSHKVFSKGLLPIEITLYPVFTGLTLPSLSPKGNRLLCIDRFIPTLSLHLTFMTKYSLISQEFEWEYDNYLYRIRTGMRIDLDNDQKAVSGIRIPPDIFSKRRHTCYHFFIRPDQTVTSLCKYKKNSKDNDASQAGEFNRPSAGNSVIHYRQVFGKSESTSVQEVKKDLADEWPDLFSSLSSSPVHYDHTNAPMLSLTKYRQSIWIHTLNTEQTLAKAPAVSTLELDGLKYSCKIYPKGTDQTPHTAKIELSIRGDETLIAELRHLKGIFFMRQPMPSSTRQIAHCGFAPFDHDPEHHSLTAALDVCKPNQLDPDKTGHACIRAMPVFPPEIGTVKSKDQVVITELILDARTIELHRSGLFELVSPPIKHERLPEITVTLRNSGQHNYPRDKLRIIVRVAGSSGLEMIDCITFSHRRSISTPYTHLAQLDAKHLSAKITEYECSVELTGKHLVNLALNNQLEINIKFKLKSLITEDTDQPFKCKPCHVIKDHRQIYLGQDTFEAIGNDDL
ncbi:hypothetical protein ACWJJH_00355 [Endozoicomonadaceae bacterium StTr2]